MLQSVKISELPSADTLTEDDLLVIDQPDATKKATLFQVLNHLEDSVEQSTLVVLAQPDGMKNIGRCSDIATLRTIEPTVNGQIIDLVSYNAGWAAMAGTPKGGGEFYYDSTDTTSADDGILTFVTAGGKRWKRVLKNNRITPQMFGMVLDGVTDEGTKFADLVSALSALSTESTYYVINGQGKTLLKSTSITIDLVKVGLEDLNILDNTAYVGATPYYILKLEGTALSSRKHKGRRMVFDRVEIAGGASRGVVSTILQNVNGVLIAPTVDLSGLVISDSQIRYVNIGVVFGNNAYLITFEDTKINSVNLAMATTVFTGEQVANLNNAGENMCMNNCVIGDSNMIARLQGFECFWTFNATSFDYTGGPVGSNYKQFANFRQGTRLDFIGCHFESGNASDCWTDNFFDTDTSVSINLVGGTTSHSNSRNACPYFFYDSGDGGQFSIDRTRLWGTGVLNWSNRGMHCFYPTTASSSSQVRGYLSERSELMIDPKFSKMSGNVPVDMWHVLGGTRTAAVVSSLLSCAAATITDAAGKTYTTLQITKLANGTNCILRLYIPCPRTHFSPHGNLSVYSSSAIDLSSAPCTLSVGFIKASPVIDTYGKPTDVRSMTKVTTDITSISTTMTRIDARGALTQSDDHLGYNYIYMSLNLASLAVGTVINITDANLEIPMKG
jgi:hypothetical protein